MTQRGTQELKKNKSHLGFNKIRLWNEDIRIHFCVVIIFRVVFIIRLIKDIKF